MEAAVLRGNLQIEIDGSGLEARLIFTPDEKGEEWDMEKVNALLSRNQITQGIDTDAIGELLKNPPKTTEPVTIVAAAGIPAVPPRDEEVEWAELPLPEDIREDAEKIAAEADDPEIVQVRIEKIKTQKKVEKKQKLPFLPPKEEIVTVVEKKEVPEKIEVDPKVIALGWVEEGGKIAVVYAGEPGKPGKDIYGNPLPPEREPLIGVYPGEGTEKKKGEIAALHGGIVRRGENWVEVLPYATHSWSLKMADDGITCLIDFTPGEKTANLPEASDILKAAEELGADSETLIPAEEVSELLLKWREEQRTITGYSISSDEDREIRFVVTEDNMKAALYLRKGRGRGKALTLKEVGSALRESGIKGFNTDKVKSDLTEFYKSGDRTLEDYLLVEGTAPEETETPKLQLSVQLLDEKERQRIAGVLEAAGEAVSEISSGKEFPLDAVQEMAFVVRHQPIASFSVPKQGKPGKDVYGKEVSASDIAKPVIKTFENISEENGQYTAEITGLLEKGEVEGETMLRVRKHRDAEIDIQITDNNLKAYLSVKPAEGAGQRTTEELLWQALKERNITKGVKQDVIGAVIEQLKNNEPVQHLLVAEGQEPKHASKNQINFAVDFADDKNVTIKQDGSADFKNLNKITTVKKGELIASAEPPDEEGEDGWDITGKTLSAKSFQGFELEIGENVVKEETEGGGFRIIAGADGKLLYDKKRISINSAHVIAGNVGIGTGNIKFAGTVQIKGNVDSGFSVIAGEAIQIAGGVDAALISAGGELVIAQGVKGGGKAVLRTKETLKAGFIEMATVLAVKDVIIKNFCLRSVVKSNGKVTLMSDKGHFVGGAVRSRDGIEVMNLGSDKGIKTEVFFGQDYLIADQIEIEEREIQKIKDKLLTFDVFMLKMEKQGQREKLEKARKEKLKLMKVLEKRGLRLFTLHEKFEEHFPSEVKVKGTIFPGVVIESHGRFYEPKQKKKNISIFFNMETGQLEERSNDKT